MVYSQHFHKNGSTSDILKYRIYSISDWICKDMAMEISHIGECLLTSLFTFFLISIRLNS